MNSWKMSKVRYPWYDIKIIVGDINAQLGKYCIFKPTVEKYANMKAPLKTRILVDFARSGSECIF